MTVGFVTVMATSMKMTAVWCTVSFSIIEIEDNSYETGQQPKFFLRTPHSLSSYSKAYKYDFFPADHSCTPCTHSLLRIITLNH